MTENSSGYDTESPAYKVIYKWGSNARFARSIGKTPSTTTRWLENGYFPPEMHGPILDAARRDDIIVRPLDLVDLRLFNERELAA